LEKRILDLGLVKLTETVLPVPEGKLEKEFYHFFVARLTGEGNMLS
jgi:hypothetical protein